MTQLPFLRLRILYSGLLVHLVVKTNRIKMIRLVWIMINLVKRCKLMKKTSDSTLHFCKTKYSTLTTLTYLTRSITLIYNTKTNTLRCSTVQTFRWRRLPAIPPMQGLLLQRIINLTIVAGLFPQLIVILHLSNPDSLFWSFLIVHLKLKIIIDQALPHHWKVLTRAAKQPIALPKLLVIHLSHFHSWWHHQKIRIPTGYQRIIITVLMIHFCRVPFMDSMKTG